MKKRWMLMAGIGMVCMGITGCLSASVKPAESTAAALTGTSGADVQAGAKVIRISFAGGDNHPVMMTLQEFEKQFEEATEGRYDVQLYANAVLGDDLKATEQVKAGELDAVVTSPSPVGTMVKEVMIFDLPYLFKDEAEADAILSGPFAAYLDGKMEEKGLINMAWYEDGFRHLTNSKKAVTTPEDVKGMKIRTMENPIHLNAWRTLGANPTPMAYTDVFTALQQHVIDGQENPFPTIYDGKFYEVQNYLTTTGHVYSPFVFIYSGKLIGELPEEDQKLFRETAKATESLNREINRREARKCRETMEEAGVEITELSPDEIQAFQDCLVPTWGDFTSIFGEEALEILKSELDKL